MNGCQGKLARLAGGVLVLGAVLGATGIPAPVQASELGQAPDQTAARNSISSDYPMAWVTYYDWQSPSHALTNRINWRYVDDRHRGRRDRWR